MKAPIFCSKLIAYSKQPNEKETSEENFAALIEFYKVSPFYRFAHLTSNKPIIEAFQGHIRLHVIDFDISRGIQWSSLIQSLSERKDVPTVSISVFGREMNVLNTTGIRKRLRDIESLNPAIVVVVKHEAIHSPVTFSSGFMESVYYCAALIDSLDEFLPLQSAERMTIGRFHIGEQIKNNIRDDGDDDMMVRRLRETHRKWEMWKEWMEIGGFTQIGLSSRCVNQEKLLL
ncbi:hypothetical protein KI387_044008 [Taxus chinensis]|uniref:Uncharacterized protein n=1 Tax=Taxus chinensis TaxID=29808 RepID=A0AA38G792_TAXCH|nr:hypothetical protein KI387_044008 [Taxus chinensis]